MTGEVGILNVGAGDTKLTFDPNDPEEVKRSAKIVKDMIRRGFVLLIEVGRDGGEPIYKRARDFDEKTSEYIIAGSFDEPTTVETTTNDEEPASAPQKAGPAAPRRGRPRKTEWRVSASGAKAVAVARTAGG